MINQLPTELIEEICSYFQDDFPSLKAYSLVCSAFTLSTRHLLFSTVTVQKTTYLQNIKLFVIAPHLAQYVRKVILILFHFSARSHSNMAWLQEFTPILKKFQAVDMLALHLVALNLLPTSTREWINHVLEGVVSLHLERVVFDNYSDIWSLIATPRRLQCLSMHTNGGLTLSPHSLLQPGGKPLGSVGAHMDLRLKRLSLAFGKWKVETNLVNQLLDSTSTTSISSLVIPLSISTSSDLLPRLNDSLERLDVDLDMKFDLENIAIHRLLDYLTMTEKLQVLGFTVKQERDRTEKDLPRAFLIALTRITDSTQWPETVRTLHLHITAEFSTSSSATHWFTIDQLLAERCESLTMVVVHIRAKRQKKHVTETTLAIRAHLHSSMAALSRSGKLRVVYEYLLGSRWLFADERTEVVTSAPKRAFSSILGRIRHVPKSSTEK
ncbi:hypothetical protein DL96DRAFT_1594013 [Flagelloscypha sp. PMI_526]|nr:hypothetical protein DL96DRAFT_1594013 [Flagelloscypha sp. PMI_526]